LKFFIDIYFEYSTHRLRINDLLESESAQ